MSNQAEQLSEIGSRPQPNTNSFIYQGATQSDVNHGSREAEESMSAAIGQTKPATHNVSTDLEDKIIERNSNI